MGAFKVTEAIEALDFDLEPYGPKGTIEEPSQAKIDRLFDAVRKGARATGIDLRPEMTEGEVASALSKADAKKVEKLGDEMNDALAAICDPAITKEQIDALPFRVRQAFTGWLLGSLTNPTRPTSATSS